MVRHFSNKRFRTSYPFSFQPQPPPINATYSLTVFSVIFTRARI